MSESLPERVQTDVEEDMRGLPHSYLDSVDDSLTTLYQKLKKKFILKRWIGTVDVTVVKESKGYHTSSSWMRRITITGLAEDEIAEVRTLIQDASLDVAMDTVKLERDSWAVEIV